MKYLRDIDFSGKSVLLRLDLNTPIDSGKVSDNERILRSLKTILLFVKLKEAWKSKALELEFDMRSEDIILQFSKKPIISNSLVFKSLIKLIIY